VYLRVILEKNSIAFEATNNINDAFKVFLLLSMIALAYDKEHKSHRQLGTLTFSFLFLFYVLLRCCYNSAVLKKFASELLRHVNKNT
jgi:hypothetical protein